MVYPVWDVGNLPKKQGDLIFVVDYSGQNIATHTTQTPQKVADWTGNFLISGKSGLVKYYNLQYTILNRLFGMDLHPTVSLRASAALQRQRFLRKKKHMATWIPPKFTTKENML